MNHLVSKKKNEATKGKKKKGFTLIELIIVIAIIAILAALAIPKFSAVRLDAKVSNDVAAAKNMQTQIATAIANGSITGTHTTESVPSVVLNNLDGKASDGKAEAYKNGVFKYTVDAKENITVFVDTYTLYPATDANRKAYLDAAKSQN